MLMLVLGNNFLVMFVGWEGVGLCSYLLIGYWYEKKSAADAGKKAFITNRIGDWGFILGIFLIFFTFGTLDFRAVQDAAAAMPVETAQFGVLSAICLLLFVGATGKSAQIPLYVWLPDAMEGPTPVSALIHAATMVTAGVYMVGRNAVLFSHAPMVMEIVAIVGVLTALMAASIGLVQNDIKRVLAYSTVSQLGYMFTAMGVGAFAAGAFHLMTHAFFKALLFLGSGSVIHAMARRAGHAPDGRLKKYLPVTFATMMIGTLAIAGIPPFVGFFSKDEILFRAFLANKVDLGARGRHGADDRVLHVPPDVDDVLRRLPRAGLGDGGHGAVAVAAAHGVRIRPIRTRTARRISRRTRSRTARPSRTTHADDAHGGHGHGAVARAARIADADDVPADGAGRRRDRRRVRRHSGGARRRQRDRALPRAELHGVAHGGAAPGEPAAERRAGSRAAAERGRRGRRSARVARGRARPDGVLGARSPSLGIVLALASSTSRTRRFPSAWRSGSPARTGRCRTSTTSTSCTTRRSSPGTMSSRPRAVDLRSQRRRRRGQRHRAG